MARSAAVVALLFGICSCRLQPDARIINGVDIDPGDYPFFVALSKDFMDGNESEIICGASFIQSPITTLLTAAHCLLPFVEPLENATDMRLSFEFNDELIAVDTDEIFIPSQYRDGSGPIWDIGLIITDSIDLDPSNITLGTIPQTSLSTNETCCDDGAAFTFVGYGENETETLQKTILYNVENQVDCMLPLVHDMLPELNATNRTKKEYLETVEDRYANEVICARNDESGLCQRDFGGPLIDEEGVVIGILSFIYGTSCRAGLPAGFLSVAHYVDWVTETIGNATLAPITSTTVMPEETTSATEEASTEEAPPPAPEPKEDPWFAVGVTFICLFVVSCIVIGVMVYCINKGKGKGGYQPANTADV